jgi:hypothetical protein
MTDSARKRLSHVGIKINMMEYRCEARILDQLIIGYCDRFILKIEVYYPSIGIEIVKEFF